MQYLIIFAYAHLDFRYAELNATLDMLGLNPLQVYDAQGREKNVSFLIAELPSEATATAIQGRCIMVERVLELWGHGMTYEELDKALEELSPAFVDPYKSKEVSFSLLVAGSGKSLTMEEQDVVRYRVLAKVPFEGPIRLKKPDEKYWLIDHIPNQGMDQTPQCIYFGREVGAGRAERARDLVGKGDLKQRAYLGPTSLDNEIALLMASVAQIKPGSVVLDPFVGTGSILIACTQFGAFCFGTDIDIRILRGKKGRNIYSNFTQYNLRPPELIRSDNALYEGHFRGLPFYDAIVCDPPYGIRAGARRTGSRKEVVKPIPDHLRADHIPQTKPYAVNDVMQDLLGMAVSALRMGGRLVYLLPYDIGPDSTWEPLPVHPCLELVSVSDQPINSKLIRKMIVMKKIKTPGGGEGEERPQEQDEKENEREAKQQKTER